MNHQEYLHLSARTSNQENDPAALYLHGIIGMISERGEIRDVQDEVNAIEEIGDVLWYLACCHRATGRNVDDLLAGGISTHADDFALLHHLSSAADIAKRWWMYGATPKRLSEAADQADRIATEIISIALNVLSDRDNVGEILSKARAINIAKLLKRYPKKFTEDCALIRDLGLERKTMEAMT